jgi:hypothetical protein
LVSRKRPPISSLEANEEQEILKRAKNNSFDYTNYQLSETDVTGLDYMNMNHIDMESINFAAAAGTLVTHIANNLAENKQQVPSSDVGMGSPHVNSVLGLYTNSPARLPLPLSAPKLLSHDTMSQVHGNSQSSRHLCVMNTRCQACAVNICGTCSVVAGCGCGPFCNTCFQYVDTCDSCGHTQCEHCIMNTFQGKCDCESKSNIIASSDGTNSSKSSKIAANYNFFADWEGF